MGRSRAEWCTTRWRTLPRHTSPSSSNPRTLSANSPELDVVIVPGGPGNRDFNGTQPHIDWLREHATLDQIDYLMSICTGASMLARSGNIAGRNATTNKAAYTWVTSVEGAGDVKWVPKARWVVDGNLWTSSGVSAGTDMILGWIGHHYNASEQERVRRNMEWVSTNQTDDPFAGYYGLA